MIYSIMNNYNNYYLGLLIIKVRLQSKRATKHLAILHLQKRERAIAKITAKLPVDALLALDSGLRKFKISFDKFLQPFDGDPFLLGRDFLRELDLLTVPALVFLSDREASQSLVMCHVSR